MSEEKTTTVEEQRPPILVNGEEVGEALIQQELQMLRERYAQEMSPQEMEEQQAKIESDARENAVERVLLMQQARQEITAVRAEEIEARFTALKSQHGGDEEFAKRFELSAGDEAKIKADIEDGVRLEKYFDEICKDAVRPGEADSQAYYDEHREEFLVPEMVHAAHIVQHPSADCPMEKVYAELLNVRERLKAGEDFDALAGEYSHCNDGGHDLGYFARGQMVQAFEDIAFVTAVGEYSDVFQSEFGYHILKVLDHKPEAYRDFKEVRYDIESMLFDARKNEAIGTVADTLRASADIKNLEIIEG
jgi:parvulin-like peptidyl-prolyl isomerase